MLVPLGQVIFLNHKNDCEKSDQLLTGTVATTRNSCKLDFTYETLEIT